MMWVKKRSGTTSCIFNERAECKTDKCFTDIFIRSMTKETAKSYFPKYRLFGILPLWQSEIVITLELK